MKIELEVLVKEIEVLRARVANLSGRLDCVKEIIEPVEDGRAQAINDQSQLRSCEDATKMDSDAPAQAQEGEEQGPRLSRIIRVATDLGSKNLVQKAARWMSHELLMYVLRAWYGSGTDSGRSAR